MTTARALDLRTDPRFADDFTLWRSLPEKPPSLAEWPAGLDPRLRAALGRRGIERPTATRRRRSHRSCGAKRRRGDADRFGQDALLQPARPRRHPRATPTRARSTSSPPRRWPRTSYAELHGLIETLGADVKTFTYDGDTPADARRAVRAAGHIVVTNPDMLHTGILPHHTKWVKLFENLRYVVIDELHQLPRRLRQPRRQRHPPPAPHLRVLRLRPVVHLLLGHHRQPRRAGRAPDRRAGRRWSTRAARPPGEKHVAVYNPPVVNRQLGIRRSALLGGRGASPHACPATALQTIVFAPSRVDGRGAAALPARQRPSAEPGAPTSVARLPRRLPAAASGARSSAALRDGAVRGVVATNALELGIDIGGLEAAVLQGYPGTLASAWQQMGRAGRRDTPRSPCWSPPRARSTSTSPRHPDYFFDTLAGGGPDQPATTSSSCVSHLKCAAFELPFEDGERFGAGDADELLDATSRTRAAPARSRRAATTGSAETFPAERVSLRSAAIDNFVIVEHTARQPRVIGEMDRLRRADLRPRGGDLHPRRPAVPRRTARLGREEGVRPPGRRRLLHRRQPGRRPQGARGRSTTRRTGAPRRAHGEVAISYLATIFKKIKLDTHENVGWGKIHLPQEDMHTTAYWLALDDADHGGAEPARRVEAGLWGVAHLLCRRRAAVPDVRPEGPAGGRRGAVPVHRRRRCSSTRPARAASASPKGSSRCTSGC